MKKYYTLILILTISLSGRAQVNFIGTYTLPPTSEITGADITDNGDLIICGKKGDHGILVKIDTYGQLHFIRDYNNYRIYWPNIVDPWNFTHFNDVIAISDSSYLAVGSGHHPSLTAAAGRTMVLIDDQGTGLGCTYGGSGSGSDGIREIIRETGSTVLLGNQDGGLGSSYPAITRRDLASGTNLIARKFGFSDYWGLNDIELGIDGSIYLSGRTNMNAGFLCRMNNALDTIYNAAFLDLFPNKVLGLADGSCIIAGDDKIARLLPSGTLDWVKTLQVGTGESVDLKLNSIGEILVAGKTGNTSNGYSWLIKLDTTGSDIWGRRYGDSGDAYLVDHLKILDNDDIRLVGHSGETDLLVIATDSSGILTVCAQPVLAYSINPGNASSTTPASSFLTNYTDYEGGNETETSISYTMGGAPGCSAGALYKASGTIFHDADQDGIIDPGEAGMSGPPVFVPQLGNYIYPNSNGEYEFLRSIPDTFTVEHGIAQPLWQLTSDSMSFAVPFSTTDTLFEDLDFGYGVQIDTTILVSNFYNGWGPCLGNVSMGFSTSNVGTNTPQGVAQFTLDTLMTFLNSIPMPDSVVGNNYYWSFDSLAWFQSWQQSLTVALPSANYIGALIDHELRIFADDGNGNLTIADSVIWQSVHACSWDPNDKTELIGEGADGIFTDDDDWLKYTIRFQNTGTDTAYNVQIQDHLSQLLDHPSLFVLGSSHELTNLFIGPGGLATFEFDNILLPDSGADFLGSQGYVSFIIEPIDNIFHLDQPKNNAGIFFDFNSAVITNTTVNTYVNCAQNIDTSRVWEDPYYMDLYATYSNFFLYDTIVYVAHQWYLNGSPISGATEAMITPTDNGYYSYWWQDEFGCEGHSDSLWFGSTGISEEIDTPIKVHPNPFNERTRIVLSEPLGTNDRLEVIDIHGRILRSVQGTGSKEIILERNELKSGIYLLKYERDGRSPVSKRIVVH